MADAQDHKTCDGCAWLEAIADVMRHDKTPFLCREPNWGGYVDTDAPNCLGRKGARVWAMKYAAPTSTDLDHRE